VLPLGRIGLRLQDYVTNHATSRRELQPQAT
jgi:hypothetical protein